MDLMNPAHWSEMFQGFMVEAQSPSYWLAVLQIIWINILLSGDNALVIAMACRGLQPKQRMWGMILGAGVAVLLRIVFTGIVATLMLLPFLKIVGGLALLYIAVKMLVPEDPDENEVEAVEHLWRAIWIVVVADIIMSLDNVIAIAAAAKGSVSLLIIGLGISIPLIVAGAALIMTLLDRFPILIWAGGALLGWIAGEVIASDPVASSYIARNFGEAAVHKVEIAAAIVGAVFVLIAGYLWRRSKAASKELAA
jgi:YjbE family integral membrane protein